MTSRALTILCVDDDRVSLRTLVRMLEHRAPGDRILEASSGEEALEIVRRERPDLVLTDLVMPHVSGLDVVEAVREALPNAEVVVITGHGTVGTAVEAMRRGALDYISKPIEASAIEEKVEIVRLLVETRAPSASASNPASEIRPRSHLRDVELARDEAESMIFAIATVLDGPESDAEMLRQIRALLAEMGEPLPVG